MDDAEAAIASGLCDMVGSARQLIAEPQFVVRAREGTEELGRTCIACNHCLGGMADASFGCAINPASYRERLWGTDTFAPAPKPSRVVVIGGGPGGLEAARVAALRGHEVTLFEAKDHLGGALELWARLPGREFYRHAIAWWEAELGRLGATLRMGIKASANDVLACGPDAVIVATGGRFSREGRSGMFDRPIPGSGRPHVHSPEDILEGAAEPQGRVVLIDGEGTHASAGVAELLGRRGAEVIMISSNHAPYSNRVVMAFEGDPVSRRLAEANVSFRHQTWVSEIGEDGLLTFDPYSEWEGEIDKVDAVVLATGRESVNDLTAQLEGKVAQLFTIGDALCVRPMATAAYEGHKFARLIGEEGAPATVGEAFFAAEDYSVYPTVAGS
jgi:pyruvate/2-oxoglutarate dehydrogenase complex dihydrolipoamide dehydrogenase (E3) component